MFCGDDISDLSISVVDVQDFFIMTMSQNDVKLEVVGTDNDDDDSFSLYQVPTTVVIVLSIFYALVSLTALFGNVLVIYVVVVSPRMKTVINFYIANMAFADVTIALFAIPFQFHAALLQRWDLPEFMCQLCPAVVILSVNVSIFTLVAISLDRYRAIIYPLRKKPSKLFSKVIIILIWMVSLAFALPMGLVHKLMRVEDVSSDLIQIVDEDGELVEKYSKDKPFCTINFGPNATNSTVTAFKYYSVSLATVEYFVPLAVITFAYARIAFRLWGSKTPGAAQDDRDHNILVNKKKVIKMLVIVVTIFAICWLPWQTFMTTTIIFPEINQYRYINIIFFCCHWLAMSNSCYNPFIYAVYSEKFHHEFSMRIPCFYKLGGSGSNPEAPGTRTKPYEEQATPPAVFGNLVPLRPGSGISDDIRSDKKISLQAPLCNATSIHLIDSQHQDEDTEMKELQ